MTVTWRVSARVAVQEQFVPDVDGTGDGRFALLGFKSSRWDEPLHAGSRHWRAGLLSAGPSGTTPTRRYADTPIRRFAVSPSRR
jgi:hypothetical protein